jgi:hypothetical protein
MSYQPTQHAAATRQQPTRDAARIETLLIDEEFDDLCDGEVAAIREFVPDYRNI